MPQEREDIRHAMMMDMLSKTGMTQFKASATDFLPSWFIVLTEEQERIKAENIKMVNDLNRKSKLKSTQRALNKKKK